MGNTVLNQFRRTAFQMVNTNQALDATVTTLVAQVLTRVNALDAIFVAHPELQEQGNVSQSIYTAQITALDETLASLKTYFATALADLPTNLSIATSHLQDQIAYGLLPIGKAPVASDIAPYFSSLMGGGVTALSTISDSLDHIQSILAATEGLTGPNLASIATNMTTIISTATTLKTTTQSESTLIVQAVADLTTMAATAGLLNAWNNPWGPFVINAVGTPSFLNALNGKAS